MSLPQTSAPASQVPSSVPVSSGSIVSKRRSFVIRLSTTIALWLIVGSSIYFQSGTMFFLLITFFSLLSEWEFFHMLGKELVPRPFRYFGIVLSIIYLGVNYWHVQTHGHSAPFDIDVATLVIAIQGAFWICYAYPLEGERTLLRIFSSILAFAYPILLFSFITRLIYFHGIKSDGSATGVYYALYLLAVTKFSDMGAYAIGSLIGKDKMVPHISPGKTWQGLGGAFLGSLVASLGLIAIFPQHLASIGWLHGSILALLLGGIAVGGDLAESVIKRCLKVKDSGNFLPGIGGVMDLTDSICFTAPVMYFYLKLLLIQEH